MSSGNEASQNNSPTPKLPATALVVASIGIFGLAVVNSVTRENENSATELSGPYFDTVSQLESNKFNSVKHVLDYTSQGGFAFLVRQLGTDGERMLSALDSASEFLDSEIKKNPKNSRQVRECQRLIRKIKGAKATFRSIENFQQSPFGLKVKRHFHPSVCNGFRRLPRSALRV